jgi:hypothetical protein
VQAEVWIVEIAVGEQLTVTEVIVGGGGGGGTPPPLPPPPQPPSRKATQTETANFGLQEFIAQHPGRDDSFNRQNWRCLLSQNEEAESLGCIAALWLGSQY